MGLPELELDDKLQEKLSVNGSRNEVGVTSDNTIVPYLLPSHLQHSYNIIIFNVSAWVEYSCA